jgi:hypothetical protein
MVNVNVHLELLGIPPSAIDEDEFVESPWRELPDAGVSSRAGARTITLSQFALRRSVAAQLTAPAPSALRLKRPCQRSVYKRNPSYLGCAPPHHGDRRDLRVTQLGLIGTLWRLAPNAA